MVQSTAISNRMILINPPPRKGGQKMATTPTPTPARKSRAARAAEQAGKDQAGLKAVPAGQAKSETLKSETPKARPTATVDLGERKVPYWFPTAKLSDGTTVSCPHARYGHEGEAAAKRCITALVGQHGHRVG
jgi:hypothetical protein